MVRNRNVHLLVEMLESRLTPQDEGATILDMKEAAASASPNWAKSA
jgi:hypothetical protein